MMRLNTLYRAPRLIACLISGLMGAVLMTSPLLLPTMAAAQARALPDFTDLVEQVGPSVVNIRTTEKVTARPSGDGGHVAALLI